MIEDSILLPDALLAAAMVYSSVGHGGLWRIW